MKNNKKGFTLAELLIVVAIIAVLTAIAIPIFTAQLERSREETDIANMRAAKAAAVAFFLDHADTNTVYFNAANGSVATDKKGIAAYGRGTGTDGNAPAYPEYTNKTPYTGKIVQVTKSTDATTGTESLAITWVAAAAG